MPKFLVSLIIVLFSLSAMAEKSVTGLSTWGAYLVLGLNHKDAPKLSAISNDVALPAFFNVVIGVDENHEMSFIQLEDEKAKAFALTDKEIESYNGDLGKLNSMLTEVKLDLSEMTGPNLHEAAMRWRDHKLHLSRETLLVLSKVAAKR